MPSKRFVAPDTDWRQMVAELRRASLRFRITAIAVLAVATILTLTALVVVVAQRTQLTAILDTALRQRANDIEALLASPDFEPAGFGSTQRGGFTQLVTADGTVLAASPNLNRMPALSLPQPDDATDIVNTVTGIPLDDDAFRVLSRSVAAAGAPAFLHVGTAYDGVGDSTEALTSTLVVSIPLLTLLLGAVVWWLVGRTIRPVEAIRSEVAAIGAGELDRRVPQPPGEDEIARLAATMNEMLDRIEHLVERQQRFVADASHELRSPLTRLRTQIEVDMATAQPDKLRQLMSLRDDVLSLQNLVEDLLHLARSDAGGAAPDFQPVDLDDLVFEETTALQAVTDKSIDVSGVSAAQVLGDASQLRRAIRNVIENAARHATNEVAIALHEIDGVAELTVADDGPGIAGVDAERVFERFGRLDASRTRTTGGTGLGLAITREILAGHGGTIRLDPGHRSGAKFVICMTAANRVYLR